MSYCVQFVKELEIVARGRGLGSQAPKEKCDLLFKVGWRSVEGVTEDDHDRAVADPNFVSLFHSVRSDI